MDSDGREGVSTRRRRLADWFLAHFTWVIVAELLIGMALIAWKNGVT